MPTGQDSGMDPGEPDDAVVADGAPDPAPDETAPDDTAPDDTAPDDPATDTTEADVPDADPADDQANDDGDAAVSRDPDAIVREIEQTRAELADAIDAIADRISPKKAASRSANAVKAQVSSAKSKVEGVLPSGSSPHGSTDAGGSLGVGPGGGGSGVPIKPLLAAAGLLALIIVFVRRRRSR
jgi:hypothetical protein